MTTIGTKHVLITGGASGLGRRLARRCASFGACVSIWDVDEDGCADAAAESAELGAGQVRAYACDVGDREQVAACAERTVAEQGEVDILVNNAGVVSGRPLMDLVPGAHRTHPPREHAVALLDDQGVSAAMKARDSGHVVTDGLGRRPDRHPVPDRLRGQQARRRRFQRALRLELKRSAPGVRTTVVAPSTSTRACSPA